MSEQARRYHFAPPEQPSLLAGLRASQAAGVAVTLAVTVVLARSAATAAGLAATVTALLGGLAAVLVPCGGRTPAQWLPVGARWLWARARRAHRWRSPAPLRGHRDGTPPDAPPPTLRAVRILAAELPGLDQPVGVIHDRGAGTYAAVLRVQGRSMELADRDEQARRLEAWGSLLAGLARSGSAVHRLQWVERTVLDGGDDLLAHLARSAVVGADDPARRDYTDLVAQAGRASRPHEAYLVVAVSAARARRAVKAAGGGQQGAVTVLLREVGALRRDLRAAEITVEGLLTPEVLSRVLRTAFDPPAALAMARRADAAEHGPGWPMATETSWSSYRSDAAFHATYWIAQWPRRPVGPDFLAHLLLGTTALRAVSLTMQPVPPERAAREVEQAVIQGLADEELRDRAGFVLTARQRRAREALARREEELAAGHADYRLSGYVTVTAQDPEALAAACGEVEQAAERSHIELRRLYGQQDTAFTCTLPLARGLD